MYKDILKKYLDDLASRKPAPGGGSAAALVAASGVALMSMVANFTIGKDEYVPQEEEMKKVLTSTEALREKLTALVDEDVLAYKKIACAYKMPRETQEDKRKRIRTIQDGLKAALLPPLEVCKASHQAMKLCPTLAEKGNVNLISDVGVAAVFLQAAFQAAVLNVEINLKGIKDKEFILQTRETFEPWEKEANMIKEKVWQCVRNKMVQETK